MQGASPLASPRLNPHGTGSLCRCGKLNGGLPRAALVCPAAVENSMGDLPRRCLLGECQRYPAAGGAGGRSPADLAAAVFAGGACLLCRPPTLPLAYFSAPIPPPPFPSGEGGDFRLFYARGFAPCIPGAEPTARRKTDRKRFPTRVPPGFSSPPSPLPPTGTTAAGIAGVAGNTPLPPRKTIQTI